MSLIRRRSILTASFVALTSSALVLTSFSSSLSSRFPIHSVPSPSPLLIPSHPSSQHVGESHLFTARLPLRSFLPLLHSSSTPRENGTVDLARLTALLTRAFFTTPLIRLESLVVAPFLSNPPSSSDIALLERGEFRKGQRFVSGAFEVVQPPRAVPSSDDKGNGKGEKGQMVVSWAVHPPAVRWINAMLQRWGGDRWRVMSGGRHVFEVEVVRPFSSSPSSASSTFAPGQEEQVELRFGCAVNYEGKEDDGKRVPTWAMEAHLGFARWLFKQTLSGLREEAVRTAPGDGRKVE
ncbi:hypothetical protein JCM8547_005018 [Rhodosporidiobolus lusitaniae]